MNKRSGNFAFCFPTALWQLWAAATPLAMDLSALHTQPTRTQNKRKTGEHTLGINVGHCGRLHGDCMRVGMPYDHLLCAPSKLGARVTYTSLRLKGSRLNSRVANGAFRTHVPNTPSSSLKQNYAQNCAPAMRDHTAPSVTNQQIQLYSCQNPQSLHSLKARTAGSPQ